MTELIIISVALFIYSTITSFLFMYKITKIERKIRILQLLHRKY